MIYFSPKIKKILSERRGLDTSTIAGRGRLLWVEREFKKEFFKGPMEISLTELCDKIKNEYPTLQEQQKSR